MNSSIIPVVLCGGSGSRLWPKSRSQYPKQFIDILGDGSSLLQKSANRLEAFGNPILVCNENHRFIAAEQVHEIGITPLALILEPDSRNTAAAVALAAIESLKYHENPTLIVSPADHHVGDEVAYSCALKKAIEVADEGRIALLGIKPNCPETGYGYIVPEDKASDVSRVKKFVEKPDAAAAEDLIFNSDACWNSGVFVFKAQVVIDELKKHAPEIFDACQNSLDGAAKDLDFIRIDKQSFSRTPNISFDVAVVEKTELASVVPLDVIWNDVGSWGAVWELSEKDDNGNALTGDALFIDSQNCLVHSENRFIGILGLNNVVVVETKDAVLVADKSRSQDIKWLVSELKEKAPAIVEQHREVFRPWGKYDSVDQSSRYQVKRITVNPGQKLSIQMHHHRAEHWIVVSGTAQVGIDNDIQLLTENQSVYIPLGAKHFLENPGKIPLEIIEVQSGAYLGEDDIVRFEDVYGRC